jgi:DNA polymerase-3 subunit epsilon
MDRRLFLKAASVLAIAIGPDPSSAKLISHRSQKISSNPSPNRLVAFETVTTGLDFDNGDRIIEIGAVEIIDGEMTGRHFHTCLDPERDIDPGAQYVHGLSRDLLTGMPVFSAIWNDLLSFIAGSELLVHNAVFHVGFLNSELARFNVSPIQYHCPTIKDTLVLARRLHKNMRHNLNTLCSYYGIDTQDRLRYRALPDAELIAQLYYAMLTI